MKITFSQMTVDFRTAVQVDLTHGIERLERLLRKYDPDLVHLHSSLETIERTGQFCFALTLTLPTGTLHSTATTSDMRNSTKAAFAELDTQLKKHQQKLRKDFEWKRKRHRGVAKPGESLA